MIYKLNYNLPKAEINKRVCEYKANQAQISQLQEKLEECREALYECRACRMMPDRIELIVSEALAMGSMSIQNKDYTKQKE